MDNVAWEHLEPIQRAQLAHFYPNIEPEEIKTRELQAKIRKLPTWQLKIITSQNGDAFVNEFIKPYPLEDVMMAKEVLQERGIK